jgi:RimJ/RimL family protein N-acetyltransferase
MELTGTTFALRPWQAHDAEALQRQADNFNIARFLYDRFPHPYTIADAEEFVVRHLNRNPLTNFVISVNGQLAGVIEFKTGEDIHRKTATMGYWLGEDYWGNGIMTEAVNLVTKYAFENFDVIRVQSTVNGNNPASRRVLEKAGFIQEGIMRKAIVKYGEVMDEYLFGLIK